MAMIRSRCRRCAVNKDTERDCKTMVPLMPMPGKCFDVYVTMACSPSSFVVQLNDTKDIRLAMMDSLQAECEHYKASDAPISPINGKNYALFHQNDARWYRVKMGEIVSRKMASVYFIDYGDWSLVSLGLMRHIPATAFLAHQLPPQALKACLFNVSPIRNRWNESDNMRFQQLVTGHEFKAMCVSIGKDTMNTSEPQLNLNLIDASMAEMYHVSDILFGEGRARPGAAPYRVSENA